MMSRKADQHRITAITYSGQHTEIQLARCAHIGSAGIAQVRIVRPDNALCVLTLRFQMREERVKSLRHMPVPQIPGRDATAKHSAVIFFRIFDKASILFSKKEI